MARHASYFQRMTPLQKTYYLQAIVDDMVRMADLSNVDEPLECEDDENNNVVRTFVLPPPTSAFEDNFSSGGGSEISTSNF